MAREIHDTIAQGLAGIVTQLQAAQGAPDAAGDEHVSAAIELARSSLSEARRSVQALAPAPLADARLPEAVREVADRWTQLHGVPVSVTTTGSARPIARSWRWHCCAPPRRRSSMSPSTRTPTGSA